MCAISTDKTKDSMHRIVSLATAAIFLAGPLSSTAQPQTAGAPRTTTVGPNATSKVVKTLPGTRANVFTTIQGNALSSTNVPLANSVVRLRDARFGRIVDTELTDRSGLFTFRGVDPGTYVIELMDRDSQTILAASQMLNVNGGEAVSAIVKLPFRIPPFAGLIGTSSTPTAAALTTQAALSGIASIVPTEPISPGS
jgi:hypothetical protein